MRTSSDRSPRLDSGWEVLVSSVRGAAHHSAGRPNEDAQAWRPVKEAGPGIVAAVADGHGHARHFRAARGAQLAVESGCECAAHFAVQLGDADSSDQIEALARTDLVPALVEAWLRAVAADHDASEFTTEEEAIRTVADDKAVVAYGSTLIVAVLGHRWVVLAQIGDGDVVALRPDSRIDSPVPVDPTLDGLYTTSLCQPNAIGSFRVAVIDRSATPFVGILLATDGFGNAQAADPWQPAVGADIIAMLHQHGSRWVRRHLPSWTERCASREGSGDDTTVLLAVSQP